MVGVAICLGLALAGVQGAPSVPAGEPGGKGLAVRCAKALVCDEEGTVIDRAWILVRDGEIEAVGPHGELEVPPDYAILDVSDRWVMPGLIDLHSHRGGTLQDINSPVYQANPGLRVHNAVVPGNPALEVGVAGGVTTVLFIPGSATTIGGQGILLKTSAPDFEAMRVRDPGSLKLAQADNPKRWGYGMNRIMLNWHIRETLRRGVAYAERWRAFEEGRGEEPDTDPQWEVFRDLVARRTQISAHTQVYQVIYATLRIVREEMGLDVYIDHGTFDGFLAAELATELDVSAIIGPRSISAQNKGRGIDHDGKIVGVAAEYQRRGHPMIGFNTDSPIVPQAELALQAAMGVRYGFDDADMGTLRGLTTVPAQTAGIWDQVGSLEAGKDADFLVCPGHPADPRNAVELVFIEGRKVYDAEEGQTF